MTAYNKTIIELFGPGVFAAVAGEVGIEVELEGKNIFHGHVPPYWKHDKDGSLRGDSAEFILRKPIPRGEVDAALSVLFKTLADQGSKLRKDSPNTSVHVHLNVQKWTMKQVCNFVCVWHILEEMLVEWCGEDRVGNVFALRGGDAEAVLFRIAQAVKYGQYKKLADQNGLRYAALNCTSLSKFGSLEARSLAGVYDADVIRTWIEILLDIKDFSEKFDNPTEVIQEFSRSGPGDFLKLAAPRWHQILKTKDYKQSMHDGMRLIQGVAYCVNWEKKKEPELPQNPEEKIGPFDAEWNWRLPPGQRAGFAVQNARARAERIQREEMLRAGLIPGDIQNHPLPMLPVDPDGDEDEDGDIDNEPIEIDEDNNGDD